MFGNEESQVKRLLEEVQNLIQGSHNKVINMRGLDARDEANRKLAVAELEKAVDLLRGLISLNSKVHELIRKEDVEFRKILQVEWSQKSFCHKCSASRKTPKTKTQALLQLSALF